MKRFNVGIIEGTKLWHLIKDILNEIRFGKRPAKDAYRKSNDITSYSRKSYLKALATAYSIR